MSKLIFNGSDGKQYTIDESSEIARGGEARIISLGDGNVAKVYFDKNQSISESKIAELSNLSNIFLKPNVGIKNKTEQGFIMKELNSSYYPIYSMFSPGFIRKHGLNKTYKKNISEQLIEAVKEAHSKNIVIGDINPFNIMVNDSTDVKFIDVDSYQTQGTKHNGKLLEDITDYYYNCKVSKDSDYFGLSVIMFNLFTFIHPYRGNHNVYGNRIKDRMLNNISIISKHKNDIVIPKFYEPITDKVLYKQFEDIFDFNKRYLISLDSSVITTLKIDDNNIVSNDLVVTTFVTDGEIKSIDVSDNYICVKQTNKITVYKIVSKGRIDKVLETTEFDDIFVSKTNIIGLKSGILYLYKNNNFDEIKSLTLFNCATYRQFGNILLSLSNENFLYKIYLDETFSTSIKYEKIGTFTKSFINYNGLIQRFGKNNLLSYNNGNDISSIIYPSKIEDVIQDGDVGVVTKKQNNKLSFELFSIDKTVGRVLSVPIPESYSVSDGGNFILIYKENKLTFLNKINFTEIASFELKNMDGFEIKNSKAGIIVYNNKTAKILNKK